MNETITLEKLVLMIFEIANGHNMINHWFFGEVPDMVGSKFPYLFVEPTTSNLVYSQAQAGIGVEYIGLTLYVMDKIDKGEANYRQTLSDCLNTLNTIIAHISKHPKYRDFNLSIDQDISCQPFRHETDDDVNGYYATINFKVPFRYSNCNIPIQLLGDYTTVLNTDITTHRLVGSQGPQGPSGPQGERGIDGEAANIGATGPVGPQGPIGPAGITGNDGLSISGPQGLKGDDGNSIVGPQGPAGVNGNNGVTGSTGQMGPQGFTGEKGATGSTGQNGLTGATGNNGADGITGATGAQGMAGINGLNGATGSVGVQGFSGIDGINGVTGSAGVTGSQGIAGANGINGATGSTGLTGATGPQGIAGANGLNGATGPTGMQGPIGLSITGATGYGMTGPQGSAGTSGPQGFQGVQGSQGAAAGSGTILIVSMSGTMSTATSSATDIGLSFSMGANEVWYFEADITGSSSNNSGCKFAVSYPSGTAKGWFLSTGSTINTPVNQMWTASNILCTTFVHNASAVQAPDRILGTIRSSGSGGIVSLRTAAFGLGNIITIYPDGVLKATRLS